MLRIRISRWGRACKSKRALFFLALIFITGKIILFTRQRIFGGLQVTLQRPNTTKTQEEIFKERRDHVIKQCQQEGRVPFQSRQLRYKSIPASKAVMEMTHGIIYCPILKVGSTFLNRLLVASSSKGTLNSPFETRRRQTDTIQRLDKLEKLYTKREVNKALKKSISFMAVRDPYAKLFSGYADKLFHPNYLFWRVTGQNVQWLIRDNNETQDEDILCGHDISFAEFVKFIIHEHENQNRLNNHFVTLHEPCDPCDIEFDYILKLETFKEDSMFLLDVLNKVYGIKIEIANFEQETAIDNAMQHIRLSFSTMKKYSEKCNVPALNFLFRTWRYLQMSGIISKNEDFPIQSESEALEMTVENYTAIINNIISRTKNWAPVKTQRKEALLQAYRSVDMISLEKLKILFESDCRYFDYDCSLETLLQEADGIELGFDYFDAF